LSKSAIITRHKDLRVVKGIDNNVQVCFRQLNSLVSISNCNHESILAYPSVSVKYFVANL